MSEPIRIEVDSELLEHVPLGDRTPLDPKRTRLLWFKVIGETNEEKRKKASKKKVEPKSQEEGIDGD